MEFETAGPTLPILPCCKVIVRHADDFDATMVAGVDLNREVVGGAVLARQHRAGEVDDADFERG